MKLSELYSKEIINIDSGQSSGFGFFKEQKKKEVLWKSIKKIGSDMIIIENE
jgi:sporulation protein YlmC with PRC-barrel domain